MSLKYEPASEPGADGLAAAGAGRLPGPRYMFAAFPLRDSEISGFICTRSVRLKHFLTFAIC